ncbi:MAG: hypothetical protein HY323_01070 [Betaproteobacteria bacterium]|nr:hypothetical protein [Betaproteobacteria bacterium]
MNDDEFRLLLNRVIEEAKRDPRRAIQLRTETRNLGAGKKRGRHNDEIDKLALFIVYVNSSIGPNGPRVNKGWTVGEGKVAELIAEVLHISKKSIDNRISQGRKLYEELSKLPVPEILQRVRQAGDRADDLMNRVLALIDKKLSSSNCAKTGMRSA